MISGDVPPAVFDLLEGDPASPVVLHVPHGARAMTGEARRGLRLTEAELARELDLLTDAHTREIARRAAERAEVTPWTFANRYSRLVVDPERFPDETEEMARVGMGAVYTRTAHGERLRDDDPRRDRHLLDTHYHPYAAGMAALVQRRLDARGRVVILDVHSYQTDPLPYELHADGPRPEICLGVDDDHTPPWLVERARAAFPGAGINSPFAGAYVPLHHYRKEPAVSALMVEIRRDTYMTEPGGPPHDGLGRVAARVAALVDAVSR
ncbi:N-formylglutamate amidohydrolase [Catenuloplanes atrovinosus]|uniref:N-formylglutamate amidohydrolase n=1 Tax=Catenuloplanes atrovinosus TaxID=137266 RepID=A0AAE4C8K1_9ACTN|nr:N-formylglutamate amidohydrolase [Catenuloplanes atrovinosus]MDR7274707.1 N-formylglutamate amidohydrolase [Catenuloplanes atrovinosus]